QHDVDAALPEAVRLVQHAIGLAHAGGGADVDLEAAALGPLDELEEILRPRPRHPRAQGLPSRESIAPRTRATPVSVCRDDDVAGPPSPQRSSQPTVRWWATTAIRAPSVGSDGARRSAHVEPPRGRRVSASSAAPGTGFKPAACGA